jgi:hypothetical protein
LTKYVFDPIWLNIPFDLLGPLEPIRWHSLIFKFPIYSTVSILVYGSLPIEDLSASHIEIAFLPPRNLADSVEKLV